MSDIERWQIPEIRDADRGERRSGEERRAYSPISRLAREIRELEDQRNMAESAAIKWHLDYDIVMARQWKVLLTGAVLGLALGFLIRFFFP
jgi:hypothetical protein